MIDKDIIQENKRIRKRNSCTRTGCQRCALAQRCRLSQATARGARMCQGTFFYIENPVRYRDAKTDRKEEKLCFAESEKMIHAGVKVENHIVSVI